MTTVESLTKDGLRALFSIGVTQSFFDLPRDQLKGVGDALVEAFKDLEGRFGVKVLGTIDDDLLSVGVTRGYPHVSYILASVPNLEAVVEVTNLVRTPYKDGRLVKYVTIDARVGHPLFFGKE